MGFVGEATRRDGRVLELNSSLAATVLNFTRRHGTGVPLRNMVDAASTQRVAAQYAPKGKTEPSERAPFLHRLHGVGGAGGIKPTAGTALQGREPSAIETDQPQYRFFHLDSSFSVMRKMADPRVRQTFLGTVR